VRRELGLEPVTLARKPFPAPASGKVRLKITLSRRRFRILQLNRPSRCATPPD
jgi:hypothetical protein